MATSDFNGADENPLSEGGAWATGTGYNALRRVSNAVAAVTASSDSLAYRTDSTELSCQIRVSATTSGISDGGPVVCFNTANGEGYVAANNSNFQLLIMKLPSFATVASAGGSNWSVGTVVRLRREGNDLIMSVNGVDFDWGSGTHITDTSYMTGRPAMFMFDGDLRFDDFDDGAGAGGPTNQIAWITA